MSAVWQAKGVVLLLALVATCCGSGDAGAHIPSPRIIEKVVGSPTAEAVDDLAEPAASSSDVAGPSMAAPPLDASRINALPVDPSPLPSSTPSPAAGAFTIRSSSPDSSARAIAGEAPLRDVAPPQAPRDSWALLHASQGSPFHQFGDDVFTWDDRNRIVVMEVPVEHPSLEDIRETLGHWDGTIEDTSGTRAWVQQCARQLADDAIGRPDAVYGAVSAQAFHACLGGLAHLAELFARYWWTEAGVTCLSDAVMVHSLYGEDRPRPLAICPSIGYDPAAPRPSGWLAQRCEEIVAANPHPRYSTGPAQPNEPLPSCWEPLLSIIETHAGEGADIGLADSPHDCYHAFLGYVWARQTDRESRPPSDLAIGCHYRAFEAIP